MPEAGSARGRSEMGAVHRDDRTKPAGGIGNMGHGLMPVEVGQAPQVGHVRGSDSESLNGRKMGRSTGLEPATLGTTSRCSNQLSYDRHDLPCYRRKQLGTARQPLKGGAAPMQAKSRKLMHNAMPNATLLKFGYPALSCHEGDHWAVLVRPAQPTLGSLVLCTTSEEASYGDLPAAAFIEQRYIIARIERMLRRFSRVRADQSSHADDGRSACALSRAPQV